MKVFFYTKLILPLLSFLKTGMSPTKLAAGIALGFVIGIIPFVGITTILCGVLAYVFRINIGVVQLVNYVAYPLQITLFIPFIKLGIHLFGVNPLPYPLESIWDKLRSDFLETIGDIWLANFYGILIWLIVAPLLYLLIFMSSKYLIKKMHKEEKSEITHRD